MQNRSPRRFLGALLIGLMAATLVATPRAGMTAPNTSLLITELYYDTNVSFEPDEYVAIKNPTASSVDISGWKIVSGSNKRAFPAGTSLAVGQTLYVTKTATTFREQQGRPADFEYGGDSDATVPDLVNTTTNPPTFTNTGGSVILQNGSSTNIDVVVWGTGSTAVTGWSGAAVPVVKAGEVMFRARDEATITGSSAGEFNTDTNSAADWKWDTQWRTLRTFASGQSFHPLPTYTFTGNVTPYVMPDSAYSVLSGLVDGATTAIDLNVYEFQLTQLMDKLISARGRGVAVRVFLEGSPVGGLADQGKYVAEQLYNNGAQVRFIVNETSEARYQRYSFDHAKYAVFDGAKVIVQSENWKSTGVPVDPSAGNRGWGVLVENASYATYMTSVFNSDWDVNKRDSFPFTPGHAKWGGPPAGFVPVTTVPTGTYVPSFTHKTFTGAHTITPVVTPDHGLLATKGIMGLLKSATKTLYVEQLYAYKYWGATSCNETDCPNLYLAEVIAAARRGVKVRVLLGDGFIDLTDPRDNTYTVQMLNNIATNEGLDLEARLVKSTVAKFEKIHNKGVIVDGQKSLVSSINWSENSPANNREMGLIIENPEIADFYTDVFYYDWYDGSAVKWPTISEVVYDPFGTESDEEWIELYNPTAAAVNIGGWTLKDNAGSWAIPSGTSIAAGQFFTVARNCTAFLNRTGVNANLCGLTLSLANGGDLVKLVNSATFEVDRVGWSNYLHNWSISAGEGKSLTRTNAAKDRNTRLDWTSNATPSPNGGTP